MEWLKRWLEVPFYGDGERCMRHQKHYNSVYCTSCMDRPICRLCWAEKGGPLLHQGDGHRILEVRVASKRAAIVVADMAKFVDVSEIQVYRINGLDILHLVNPNVERAAIDGPRCETCRRKLIKPGYKFCSIACKVDKVGPDMELKDKRCERKSESCSPSSDIDFEIGGPFSSATIKLPSPRRSTIKIKIKNVNTTMNGSTQLASLRKRKRKGIPRRALFH